MPKLSLADLAGSSITSLLSAINNNNTLVETAMENTLSRDGTSPNQMGASLDMNSNRILNLPVPTLSTDAVRLQDITTPPTLIIQTTQPSTSHPAGSIWIDSSVLTMPVYQLSAQGGTWLVSDIELRPAILGLGRQMLTVMDYGATGNGVTDDTAAITAAISAAVAANKPLYFPNGNYLTVAGIDVRVNGHISIILEDNAIIVGEAGHAVPVINIDGGSPGAVGEFPHHFMWLGGRVDNSRRDFGASVQSGTALSVKRFGKMFIRDCEFYAAEEYNTDFGDSGITAQEISDVNIEGCSFFGQPDLGVYITGDGLNDTDVTDFGCRVTNNYFWKCQTACSIKRLYHRAIFANNVVDQCRGGFTTFEALTSAGNILPGQDTICANNIFHQIETRAVEIRISDGGSVITGNIIRDWGYDPDGNVSSIPQALRLLGCQNCIVANNSFAMIDWIPTAHTAVFSPNYTLDAVVHQNKNNTYSGNKIYNCTTGIQSSGTGPNTMLNNEFFTVTTKYTLSESDPSMVFAVDNTLGFGVGKTAISSLSTQGVGILGEGLINAVRDAAAPFGASRLSSYGPIFQFYKDAVINSRFNIQSTGLELESVIANGNIKLIPNGTGTVVIPIANVVDYADDTAAALGGVIVGGVYRTGSALKIRAA